MMKVLESLSLNSQTEKKKIGLMIDLITHLKKETEHGTECGKAAEKNCNEYKKTMK